MKLTKHFTVLTLLSLLAMLCLATTMPARAAEYDVIKTFWNVPNFTNNPGTVTNLAQVCDLRKYTDFALHVKVGTTNPAAGSIDVVWDSSLDGSSFPVATNASLGRNTGWFSVPITNNNVVNIWITNITVDSVGYWRIRAITNNTVQHITNIQIRAYGKPQRTNRDY